MDNISTEIEARRLTAPRPSKPGVKAWAGSLIALGLVAGGVIAGPRLLAPSADQAAIVTPPVVAVSVPLQRDVDTTLQFLGQFSAVDEGEARVRGARFDLAHCRITAPFTGRIGSHLVSVGNLIAGSRAATSPTTLLAALVSIDPIYLNFDMSEADYMRFLRGRQW